MNLEADKLLVVGLGNPGKQHEGNRHNIGFMFVDYLQQSLEATSDFKMQTKFQAETLDCVGFDKKLLLAKPQTFMNESGQAVAALAKFYKIDCDQLIVIFDDLDLPLGKLRLRYGGGNGGHNGIKSIASKMGSSDFYRIRIGIGRPGMENASVTSHVLGDFRPEEAGVIEETFDNSFRALDLLVKKGLKEAQNKFN